jgi:hypothetical protein
MRAPEHVREAINLRQPPRATRFEDIEVVYDGRSVFFSCVVEHHLDAAGYRVVDRVLYQDRPVTLPPGVVSMFEEMLEEDDK